MQADWQELYRLTAARTGKDEALYKAVGNFVLQAAHNHLDNPPSLIIKLKGIGYWFLKRRRLLDVIAAYPVYYDVPGYDNFVSEEARQKFKKKLVRYNTFKARIADYERYLARKQELKQRKDEFKAIQGRPQEGPPTGEDQPS